MMKMVQNETIIQIFKYTLELAVKRSNDSFQGNISKDMMQEKWLESVFFSHIIIIMSQRKQTLKGKDSTGTPTKVAHPSPSKQPTRSPLTASKFNASNSKPNVSYGELQIVLENIQEIRRKANQQITALTAENQKLKEDLTRSHQDFQELANRLNRSNSKNDYQIKVLDQLDAAEMRKKQLEEEVKERVRTEVDLQARNNELLRVIEEKEEAIVQIEKKIEEWAKKWQWAFGILAGDHNRSEQLIWMVKNQYPEGIWSIIDQNASLTQELSLKTGKLQVLQRELAEIKHTSKQTTAILEKSMAEVASLNLKLLQQQQETATLRERCIIAQNEASSNAKDYKLQQSEYQTKIASLEEKVVTALKEKQASLYDLTNKTARLEEELQQRDLQIAERKKHEQYQALISQVCEESQDYSQMLERLRYLQKFKTEHYFNVEKIQYLCKMLDY